MGQLVKWILSCGDRCGEVMVCFDHYLQVHVVEETLQCPPQIKCPWCGGVMRDADHCKVGSLVLVEGIVGWEVR